MHRGLCCGLSCAALFVGCRLLGEGDRARIWDRELLIDGLLIDGRPGAAPPWRPGAAPLGWRGLGRELDRSESVRALLLPCGPLGLVALLLPCGLAGSSISRGSAGVSSCTQLCQVSTEAVRGVSLEWTAPLSLASHPAVSTHSVSTHSASTHSASTHSASTQ